MIGILHFWQNINQAFLNLTGTNLRWKRFPELLRYREAFVGLSYKKWLLMIQVDLVRYVTVKTWAIAFVKSVARMLYSFDSQSEVHKMTICLYNLGKRECCSLLPFLN